MTPPTPTKTAVATSNDKVFTIHTGERWMGYCNGHSQMLFLLSQGWDDDGKMVITDQGDPEVALYATRHPAPSTFTICGAIFNIVWYPEAQDWVIQVVTSGG